MWHFLSWYLVFALLGIISFPLAFNLLSGLAGRGYAFTRILGLLFWGYCYWLLGSLGVLQAGLGGQIFAALVLLGISAWLFYRRDRAEWQAWWQQHRGMVITAEILFLVAFGAWTLVRAMNPEITATEKPMELAFLNAILRAPQFPPHDPWLSGYAISYYYFGFVLVAMLAAVTATPAGIAFNLGVAAIFGLSALGAYGLLYGLIAGRKQNEKGEAGHSLAALLGPIFVLLVSNLEGFLDMLHARGLFWPRNPDGTFGAASAFWKWLDLKDLVNPPVPRPEILAGDSLPFFESLQPNRFLWWWRASRVVNDTNFAGQQQEVIDEFPFFSFLLSDLHPHVMAIPFVLLAVALALNFFLQDERTEIRFGGVRMPFSWGDLAVVSLALGSLAFLNTWDFPIYVALFAGAFVVRRVLDAGWSWNRAYEFIGLGLLLGVLGVLFYFPFYLGFSSQAGGILPNVLNPTRGRQLWVMFGTLFVPLFAWLAFAHWKRRGSIQKGFLWGFGLTLGLLAATYLVILAAGLFPQLRDEALRALQAPSALELLRESLARRFYAVTGWLTLATLLSLVVSILVGETRPEGRRRDLSLPGLFAILMALLGTLLVMGPEFFYLRDLFGTRMNTVFKFYYQAWILLGLAAAYGTAVVLREWRGAQGWIAGGTAVLFILLGLVYPALSLQTKTAGALDRGLTLDGTVHEYYLNANEKAAVRWLQVQPLGTLLEGVDGSYSSGGRFATHTGHPNVLGWVFHQGQWRGGYEEVGSRSGDVEQIYSNRSWDVTVQYLDQYEVDYIIVGQLERRLYTVNEAKFRRNLPVLFEQADVVVYGYGSGE